MPIHEVSLIRPENLHTQENLVVDGVDVSGHWSTFIESRAVTDYNEALEEEIAALPAGRIFVHPGTQLDISSTDLREALRAGRDPRYLMPEPVRRMINATGIYARQGEKEG